VHVLDRDGPQLDPQIRRQFPRVRETMFTAETRRHGHTVHVLGAYRLTADGRCQSCGTACAGRFEPVPGTWGARRLPVRLAEVAVARP